MKIVLSFCFALMCLVMIVPTTQAQTSNADTSPLFKHTFSDAPSTPPINIPALSTFFKNDESNQSVVQNAINWAVILLLWGGTLISLGFVLYGGIRYIMAGPNPAAVEQAKKIIVGSIVGLIIIALSSVIVEYVLTTLTKVGT